MSKIEEIFDDILSGLKEIISLLRWNKKPKRSIGTTVLMQPNGSTTINGSAEIEVPSEWSDDWCLKILPTDNYLENTISDAKVPTITGMFEVSSGAIIEENYFSFSYDPVASVFSFPSDNSRWMPIRTVGQCFKVSGHKVTVKLACTTSTVKTTNRPIIVTASRGAPKPDTKNTLVGLASGTPGGVAVPRFAKAFRIIVLGALEDLSDVGSLDFVNIAGNVNTSIGADELVMFGDGTTFDATGAVAVPAQMTKWLPIMDASTCGLRFPAPVGLSTGINIEWLCYE